MPASRKQETEADYIGLMIMTQGCYKPQTAIEFWARMEEIGSQRPTQILDTHPSYHDRKEKLREWLPKSIEKAEASECSGTSQFGMLLCSLDPFFSHQLPSDSLLVLIDAIPANQASSAFKGFWR